jgi:hypothetical protein
MTKEEKIAISRLFMRMITEISGSYDDKCGCNHNHFMKVNDHDHYDYELMQLAETGELLDIYNNFKDD